MRVHEMAPSVFVDKKVEKVDIIRDIVGFRPARTGGVRVEKERLGGQEVIHAYGMSSLIFSSFIEMVCLWIWQALVVVDMCSVSVWPELQPCWSMMSSSRLHKQSYRFILDVEGC